MRWPEFEWLALGLLTAPQTRLFRHFFPPPKPEPDPEMEGQSGA